MPNVKFKIADQFFFNNADLILSSIKDSSGNPLQDGITSWLTQTYDLDTKDHTENGITRSGYDAGNLNTVLRATMGIIAGIHKETYVDHGAILKAGKKGFDFSLFDEEYNIVKLRNAFVGNPGKYNGDVLLLKLYKKVLKEDGTTFSSQSEWETKLSSLGGTGGENLTFKKRQYTVVGEIQFGNWALAGHDFLRLINSELAGEVDYYVYVTVTGQMATKLSKGIVTFEKCKDLLSNNIKLIRNPVWVIGIDIDDT